MVAKIINQKYYAPLTVIADGFASNFRKRVLSSEPEVWSHFVGLIIKNANLPFPNKGNVVLATPSPILLYQIGTEDTRILVDIPGKLPSAGNGDLKV